MDRIFDFHIEKLKTRLIKMCSLVDEQVDFAIKSIEEQNKYVWVRGFMNGNIELTRKEGGM